ncbi:MAG: hypothetical protein SGILL_007799, partial [Bacillariaceae sp.]
VKKYQRRQAGMAVMVSLIAVAVAKSIFSAYRFASVHILQSRRQQPKKQYSECLIMVHIPKCGGTSFRDSLKETAALLGWDFMSCPKHSEKKSKRIKCNFSTRNSAYTHIGVMNENINEYLHKKIYFGHIFPTNFINATDTSTCYKMTMLREPIDRVISNFYYSDFKEERWPEVWSPLDKECGNTPELHRDANSLINGIARMLGMAWDFGHWNVLQQVNKLCRYTYDPTPDRTLDRAKQVLQDMDLVCFLDDYEACLQRVNEMLGLPVLEAVKVPHVNVDKTKKNEAEGLLSPHDLAMANQTLRSLIASANQLDVELYQWAVARFKEPPILDPLNGTD